MSNDFLQKQAKAELELKNFRLSYQTPEDYYNALKSLKESFDANRWGREYISSFELPSMEELAGADKKLDFGEVRFRLTLTDQAGTVLGSQEVVGAVQ